MSDKQSIQHVITGGVGRGRTAFGLRAGTTVTVDPMGKYRSLADGVDGGRFVRVQNGGQRIDPLDDPVFVGVPAMTRYRSVDPSVVQVGDIGCGRSGGRGR